jgi:hypothetical protein
MKRVVSLLVALLPLAALACPLLIPPKRLDLRPTAPPYTGIFRPDISSVAIDGDTVAVAAQRPVGDNEVRYGEFLFGRAADARPNAAGVLRRNVAGPVDRHRGAHRRRQ